MSTDLRWRRAGLVIAVPALVAALTSVAARSPDAPPRPTDFGADLERLERALGRVSADALAAPFSSERAARHVALLQRRASLTGSVEDEVEATHATRQALQRVGPTPALLLLAADWALRFHRVPEARQALDRLPEDGADPSAEALRADLALQEGRYAEARRRCEAALAGGLRWDLLARLAYIESRYGEPAAADALYARASDELTVEQMRAFSWLELQRGRLALDRGRYSAAAEHYSRADRAYSGDWRVAEHRAELLAAQGRLEAAAALYESVVARAPRPELQQAFGDLLVAMGRVRAARVWHERAERGYRASAARGEVHYFHHLAGLYSDVLAEPAEALRWARADRALRGDPGSHEALGWALYRAGRLEEALDEMRLAVASGVRDAHLLARAATVHEAAGRTEEGDHLRARAADLDPRQEAFHVHR